MIMKTVEQKMWRNWAHTSESRPAKTFYPASITDVCTIVKEATLQNKTIRVVGAGHSFTRLVQTDDWLISLDYLTGIDDLNEDEKTVTVFAGTRLYELGEELGTRGYSQENLGDINVQSVAGAISTGTHGTGIAFGNLSSQVTEIVLVTAMGEVLTISEEENPYLLKACLLSLGTLGIIVKVTFKIVKSPVYEFHSYKLEYRKLEAQLEQLIESNRHFEFYLFPYSELVQIKTMNITEKQPQKASFYHFKNLLLENYLFYLISECCRLLPKTSKFFSRVSAKGVGTSTISAYSYQLFATPRLVRFREIEYCIPLHCLTDALREVRETIEKNEYAVHFPIECRTVKADDIWLSPSYERDSAYIAFHMYKGMPYEQYFYDMEEIMQKYEGRPHWGKMHSVNREQLNKLYPRLQEFLHVRKQLDPDGLFLNPYLTDLFGIEEKETVNL